MKSLTYMELLKKDAMHKVDIFKLCLSLLCVAIDTKLTLGTNTHDRIQKILMRVCIIIRTCSRRQKIVLYL